MILPTITKVTKTGKEGTDILSYMFSEKRKIIISDAIDSSVAAAVVAQLEYLDSHGSGDIKLYINSPGGSVTDGFAITDAIQRCKNDICTICNGMAASMGAFILSCGTKGKRWITPNSEVMIHQPLGGAYGQATDIELSAKHILKTKDKLNRILSENTGQPIETVIADSDRDNWMSAREAIEYGIVDGFYT